MILVSGQYADDLIPRLSKKAPVVRLDGDAGPLPRAVEVLVTRGKLRVSSELIGRLPRLRVIIKAGAGLDTIDLLAARRSNVRVVATGGSDESVADLALALLMNCLRNVNAFDGAVRRGDWDSKARFLGTTVASRRVGIAGFGRIGRAFARMVSSLGSDVIYWDRSWTKQEKADFAAAIGATRAATLLELVQATDVLSLHLPLTDTTRGLIGRREFETMRKGTVLVNTARASIVEHSALVEALRSGTLSGAGLDVHYDEGQGASDPIFYLPNVVLTPHIGAQSAQAHQNIADRIVQIVDEFIGEAADSTP